MSVSNELKELIFKELQKIIEQRIENSQIAIQSAYDAKNNETKSSAGDKYETGRAMMQMEQERNELQLSKALELKNLLSQININKTSNKVVPGSLVITTRGNYFISIGIGKIKMNNEVYYCISLDSPIGQVLQNKLVGVKCVFNGSDIRIVSIA